MRSITGALFVNICGNRLGTKPLVAALKPPMTTPTSMMLNASLEAFSKLPS